MAWSVAALVVLAAALLAPGGLRRARRRKSEQPRHDRSLEGRGESPLATASQPAEDPDRARPKTCPVCLSEYPTPNRYCVRDGAELMEGHASGPLAQGMICPTCRRGYPFDSSYCPEDADELVPHGLYGAASATRPPVQLDSHKICPECGIRHAAAHLFCGQDGAELVAVN